LFAPSFLSPGACSFVRQIILQRAEKKRAEFAAVLVRSAHRPVFEKMDKEALGQVLRIRLGKSETPNVGKDWRPIIIAKLGERVVCFSDRLSRSAHLAPLRCRKTKAGVNASLREGSLLGSRMAWSRHSLSHKTRRIPKTAR